MPAAGNKRRTPKSKKTSSDAEFCRRTAEFNSTPISRSLRFRLLKLISPWARHTLTDLDRRMPDTCTGLNIWKYEVMRNGKLVTSTRPITTTKTYQKNSEIPQLISCSLFGSSKKYVNGVFNMLKSLRLHGMLNLWDVRVYVASRKDGKKVHLATSAKCKKDLLDMGVEIAHVDNGNPNGYSLEGTFWRFCACSERARVLCKDVDWIFTAHELIALSEWIESGLTWHRSFHSTIQISPLVACCFGVIGGPQVIKDLKSKIKHYPFKKNYGDDEMFLLMYMFLPALRSDSVCTHYYDHHWMKIFRPHDDSIFYPTAKYIETLTGIPKKAQNSKDILLPSKYGLQEYDHEVDSFDKVHIQKNKAFLSLSGFGARGRRAVQVLNLDTQFHT